MTLMLPQGNNSNNYLDKNYFHRIELHLNSMVYIGYIFEVGVKVKAGAGWQDNTSRRKQCNRNHIHQSWLGLGCSIFLCCKSRM